ncbi:MAG TPA: Hsp20/alpha crystallin family protein [Pyrinomonadaceae bacterium]|nr:Hsp20/alpha crystallin family protein [Pyrinomonadaceae bacterium]
MSMIKFDPFRELRTLNDEMNRLFSAVPASVDRGEFARGSWSPNVDIYEDENRLIVEAELPGMNREDFEVSVENNVLTLKGERKFEKKTEGDNYHRVERAYGSFTRQFTLPQTITAEGATADFENGVLRVALPKREETKARKIEITASGTGAKAIETESRSANA